MVVKLLSLGLTTLSLLAQLSTAQAPGPDWPSCSESSRGHVGPWGWELLDYQFRPIVVGHPDAQQAYLWIDAQNLADGSRTLCGLRANATAAAPTGPQTLTNRAGGCETFWIPRRDYSPTNSSQRAPTASVTYNTQTHELSIVQTWFCREETGQFSIFTGTASLALNSTCQGGKEGEPPTCYSNITPGNPGYSPVEGSVFLHGAASELSSITTPTPTPVSSSPNCVTSSPTWQILSLTYSPPGPWPKSPTHWSAGVGVELRNLADGSRIDCVIGTDDTSGYNSTGLVLRTSGQRMTYPENETGKIYGCEVGGFVSMVGRGGKTGWVWKDADIKGVEVAFDTKTQIFTVNQTWECEGGEIVSGQAEVMLGLDCYAMPEREWAPVRCIPRGTGYSNSSGLVVVGPGRAGVVSSGSN